MNLVNSFKKSIPIVFTLGLFAWFAFNFLANPNFLQSVVTLFLILFSTLLTVQGLITLGWMLYAWDNNKVLRGQKYPRKFAEPKYSFTAIVPVRSEEDVVADTINSIDKINYPKHLKEIIIVVRHDDKNTIDKAQEVIANLDNDNHTVLVLVDSHPINKPVSLNHGLNQARHQIVTIFDAEDEPDPEIYNMVNTAFVKKDVDVVQAGVALMNYNSHWYSALNVMEYYFWFKSGLYLINNLCNVSLLGGNTVFIKKKLFATVKLDASYDNNISYTDMLRNKGRNWNVTPGAIIRLDIQNVVHLNFNAGYTFYKTTTQYATYTNINKAQTLQFGLGGKNYFFKDLTLGYDVAKTINYGFSNAASVNPLILNLYTEYRFLKGKKSYNTFSLL